jgi:molecular chaperone GrpE
MTMSKRRHDETEPRPATTDATNAAGEAAAFAAEAGPDAADGGAAEAGPSDGAEWTDGDESSEGAAPPPPSAEDLLRRERDEFQDKWLRTLAELDNMRKRSRRDIDDARRFAKADALRGVLDVLDNLERALQSYGGAADTGAPDAFREGIELIRQRLRAVLQDQGVTPIEALGLHLDPLVHEAVGQLPREGSESGTIIEVAQAGWRLGDLVLRPARVIICA